MNLPLDQIICGDNCDVLGTFPRECIDLVVTSPPYDDLRTYGGHSWDFYGVAWQLKRILKPGGVIVWVVADQTKDGSETGTSFEQALHFKRLGLNLHDTMIWKKANPSPGDGKFRYHDSFEYMFILSLGVPQKRALIRDVPTDRGGEVYVKTSDRRKTGKCERFDRKPWVSHDVVLRGNVWTLTNGANDRDNIGFGHPAGYPESLAADHIRSWSNESDIVLDPFNGSGTTTKMARELGRHWIGIDVNEEYCEIARRRMAQQLLPGMGPPVSVSVGGADSVSVPSA